MKITVLEPAKSVLEAIHLGGRVVHGKYLSTVLALAAQGMLTQAEQDELRLPDGRMIFCGKADEREL